MCMSIRPIPSTNSGTGLNFYENWRQKEYARNFYRETETGEP